MIVVHGETLWSPAPQPMDDDDDRDILGIDSEYVMERVTTYHTRQRKDSQYNKVRVCKYFFSSSVLV